MPRRVGPRKSIPYDFDEREFDNSIDLLTIALYAPRLLTFDEKFAVWCFCGAGGVITPLSVGLFMGLHWRDVRDIFEGLQSIGILRHEPGSAKIEAEENWRLQERYWDQTDNVVRDALLRAIREKFGGGP